ncbi:uncharacterized protein [Leptinotarsa decemlineata]|uniref:uncharacterized protein n=1 Tax=Leptinotarsa decemlineata TaxID=7539 RepID=UPI003D3067AD
MNKEEYVEKILDFLNAGMYDSLRNDPTHLYQKDVKETFKNIHCVMDEKEKFRSLVMNPQPPKLYSLVKLHKDNYPIRPVVSFVTAPSVEISEKLIAIIQNHTNFKSKFSLKNSYHLINEIQDFTLPDNAKLISSDVKNLFPSIPPNETITLVENLLDKNSINPVVKNEILDLLTVQVHRKDFVSLLGEIEPRIGSSTSKPIAFFT